MTLRIGWAGPWNSRSAIASFGAEVVTELVSRGHAVEILRTETGSYLTLEARPAPCGIRTLAEFDPAHLRRKYDVVIVNLGDHFGFHGAALPVLPQLGAVAILHDSFYANLASHGLSPPENAPVLRAMVQAIYGDNAMTDEQSYWLPLRDMAACRSMLEWFAGPVIGAVAHAEHYAERIRHVCPGPVAAIPLAYTAPNLPPPRPIAQALVVATIGHINPNKCIDRVMAAIGGSEELRLHCHYRLIGFCEEEERKRLLALASERNLPTPEFAGWVPEAEFPDRLRDVDVISCLRNPVLEGGSASVITGMLSGRPVLVSDQGVYAEIPDDLVLKCEPGNEVADVTRHLLAVLRDAPAAQAMGRRARHYALDRHNPRVYVDALLPFLEHAISGGPPLMAAIQIGRTLASIGLRPDDPALARAVESLAPTLEHLPEAAKPIGEIA
jgi:glycosyltransferase involved in cell wall biosynthesis